MDAATIIALNGISKSFPGVQALSRVSFDIRAGEVHALCGENGAGKSTLMKILGGHLRPDAGTITCNGREAQFRNPLGARQNGILLVHQEISLVPGLSVAENIFLGNLPRSRFGRIQRSRLMADARRVLSDFGYDLDPAELAGGLSIARQQMVEIARAVAFSASVVIFDEPTSSLTENEAAALFRVIVRLKAKGVGIVYISHRMREVMNVSDRVTVLRDGTLRGTLTTASTTEEEITRLMIGRDLNAYFANRAAISGEEVLRLEAFSGEPDFRDISFSIRAGEIVGLYGLVGAGRSELAETIFGIRHPTSGDLYWRGEKRVIGRSSDAMTLGIGLCPENCKEQGLVLDLAARDNISLSNFPAVTRSGIVRRSLENRLFAIFQERLSISAPRPSRAVRLLSGGNQQKIVIAKWLSRVPQLLILDEPTRGIDVGSKAEIHRLIASLAEDGMAILVISSEMPEMLGISHRILAMYGGRITTEFSAADVTEEGLMAAVSGPAKDLEAMGSPRAAA